MLAGRHHDSRAGMKIVVAVDGSVHADRALQWAADEAVLRKASLTVFHAYRLRWTGGSGGHAPAHVGEKADATELVRTTIDRVIGDPPDVATAVEPVRGRRVAGAVLHHSRDADLLVLGSRGLGGFPGLLLGSVSQQVVAHASVPVAVVPVSVARTRTASVVVGVDGSASASHALDWAFEEAGLRDVPIQAVLAYPPLAPVAADATATPPGALHDGAAARAREELSDIVADALGAAGHSVDLRTVAGQAARVLIDDATNPASLLVVGSRGLGGFAGVLLGSVSLQCLTHAAGPVVVVHSR
jgi:nucleotide-binding universal stress UspA family protein